MRKLLTEKTVSLLEDLEALVGKTISTKPATPEVVKQHPMAEREVVLKINEFGAEIYYPDAGYKEHDIVHELLHIQRYWVEQVPMVHAIDGVPPNQQYAIRSLCNDIEHCVIIPREQSYLSTYLSSKDIWTKKYDKILQEIEEVLTKGGLVTMSLTRAWLVLNIAIKNSSQIKPCRDLLLRTIQKSLADKLLKVVRKSISDKTECTRKVIRLYGIDKGLIQLIQYDAKNQKRTVRTL